MKNITERLYKDSTKCDEHDLYTIIKVDGNSVSKTAIAETDFDSRTITVPTFKTLPFMFKKKYGELIEGLQDYLFGHEAEVEAEMKPVNEDEHAAFERDYLERLKDDGKWMAYFTGLATHKIRLKNGDKTGFSTKICDYIDAKLEQYAYEMGAIEPIVDEALSPEFSV